MTDHLTDSEINSATKALKAWFQSQEIAPGDAGIIVIKLMAELYTTKSRDIQHLARAVQSHNLVLAYEIAECLQS